MITIYHNLRCQKSRQTLAILTEKMENVDVINYLEEPPSTEQLNHIVKLLGISPEELVRKNEAAYKDHFKGKALSDEEWLQAMVDHPKLIERPIVIVDNKAVIGRPPENVLSIL